MRHLITVGLSFFVLQIEKLRSSIQTLTRSANPLGKIMDYVQVGVNQNVNGSSLSWQRIE